MFVVCVFVSVCLTDCVCVCAYMCMYVCVCMYVYTNTHIHTHTYNVQYVCMYVCLTNLDLKISRFMCSWSRDSKQQITINFVYYVQVYCFFKMKSEALFRLV